MDDLVALGIGLYPDEASGSDVVDLTETEMESESAQAMSQEVAMMDTKNGSASGQKDVNVKLSIENVVVLKVTSSSVHLCWEDKDKRMADNSISDSNGEDYGYEYQVRYYRTGFRTSVWRYCSIVTHTEYTIEDLTENTTYTISVRCRKIKRKNEKIQQDSDIGGPETQHEHEKLNKNDMEGAEGAEGEGKNPPEPSMSTFSRSLSLSRAVPWISMKKSKTITQPPPVDKSSTQTKLSDHEGWGPDSNLVEITTWSKDREERLENLDRLYAYLAGTLSDYNEEPHKPDTILDKATRSMDGLLSVAGMLGVGGKWLRLAKQAWKVRQYGLAALIFREDLQEMVITLSSQVGSLNEKTGLSSKEIILGCYYYFWERKKERLIFPDMEYVEHREGEFGVLEEEAPMSLLEEMSLFFSFSRLAYHSTPAEIQWILTHLSSESPSGETKCSKSDGFRLICFRPNSGKMRPAFMLVANKSLNIAILSIRGTKEVEDMLTNQSFAVAPAVLGSNQVNQTEYYVHSGMLQAAKWLIDGDAQRSKNTQSNVDGAGLGLSLLELHKAGYSIKLCGHSLGAGVAIICGLLLADLYPDMMLAIYGYGTPPCVDVRLAEAMKMKYMNEKLNGKMKTEASAHTGKATMCSTLGSRIMVKNFVTRDDMVSRLSLQNIHNCAMEIKESKKNWERYLQEDTESYTARAKSLWAPPQRAQPLSSFKAYGDEAKTIVNHEVGTKEQVFKDQQEDDTNKRLFIPGIIVHSHRFRGTDMASVVDYRHGSFNRIQAFQNMQADHTQVNIALAMKSVVASRNAVLRPPPWQSIDEAVSRHELEGDQELATKELVSCSICKYFVGWSSSIGGTSGAVEIRSTNHCTACGKIVCAKCSPSRRTIPEYGVIKPSRICDVCESKYALRFELWNQFDAKLSKYNDAS